MERKTYAAQTTLYTTETHPNIFFVSCCKLLCASSRY
jgi:hypothetical protein